MLKGYLKDDISISMNAIWETSLFYFSSEFHVLIFTIDFKIYIFCADILGTKISNKTKGMLI